MKAEQVYKSDQNISTISLDQFDKMASNSSEDISLEDLNTEEAKLYLGGAVLVILLIVSGIVGNIHVLLVYTFRMKPSNHRIFILCLAILDTITCSIGMPFVVINFRRPFMFYESVICKILTFNNFFICISSAGVLLVIAVDRYRKICVPMGKQMSMLMAKIMCFVAMIISLLLSWPAVLLYGSTHIETRVPGLDGKECNVLHDYKHTNYPVYFNGVLLVVSVSCFIVLVVLYSFIGKVIWNHRSFQNKMDETATEETNVRTAEKYGFKNEPNFHSGSSDSYEYSDRPQEESSTAESSTFDKTSRDQIIRVRAFSFDRERRKSSVRKSISKFDRTKRTTIMLFWITIIFFISYVPYLTLRIASILNPQWYPDMSFAGKVTFNTFLWCVFINNMANSIIYGFCDLRFRQQVKRGYRQLFSGTHCKRT